MATTAPETVKVDELTPKSATVGYGRLGLHGELGYESGRVFLGGCEQANAISAHGPSLITYTLDGQYRRFDCRVGFNQDADGRATHAHFLVSADGREVACAPLITPNEGLRELSADISGATTLELTVLTDRWEYCHSIWLNPAVSTAAPDAPSLTWNDPLQRSQITLPRPRMRAERCIATVVTPGYEEYLGDLLWSLRAFGGCRDTPVVIFGVDATERCRALAAAYDAHLVECRSLTKIGLSIKAVLYSVASVVDADWYLCLDADTLVLGSLEPVFAACELAPPGKVLVCREANSSCHERMGNAIRHTYYGEERDISRILGGYVNGEANYSLVVNDGVFAGGKQAMLALEAQVRKMPQGIAWMEERARGCWWRNQFLFNLALARLHSGWELDHIFNVQLHTHDVVLTNEHEAHFRGRPVRLLHFCGIGKTKYVEWRREMRQRFAKA